VYCVVRQTTISTPSSAWSLRITVDPLILRQGKSVDLKVEIVLRVNGTHRREAAS